MKIQYSELDRQMHRATEVLDNLQDRDAHAHRMIFGMNPIDDNVWDGGVGGHDRYEDMRQYRNSGDLMASISQKMDKLNRQLVMQSQSLDTIQSLASEKEKMLASIPSIKPVRSDKLNRNIKLLSGFGRRIHPIHKVWKMHAGIDFSAPTGTAIQATGDGKVVRVEHKKSGYGTNVVVDHGYGYKTLYAHMSKVLVTKGQKVNKGQKIGLVGSTGTSTAPHCHYEIHHKGQKINPIHYCLDGLNPNEYQSMVDAAAMSNQSFD
ncbi:MAG: peptidoglycan DD-metalloendopeptidase family protein [Saprospiraceae bacterium]